MEGTTIINRVAESGLITINLEDYFPNGQFIIFDIKNYLYMELILREKDFREALKTHNWSEYKDKIVLVTCSTDAIVPLWAFMLIEVYIADIAKDTYRGSEEEYLNMHYRDVLSQLDYSQYMDKRIVIKGCSQKPVPSYAYSYITAKLKPFAQSIMFGEPCSTVPIFKRPRNL